jgi:hypothetical protein
MPPFMATGTTLRAAVHGNRYALPTLLGTQNRRFFATVAKWPSMIHSDHPFCLIKLVAGNPTRHALPKKLV